MIRNNLIKIFFILSLLSSVCSAQVQSMYFSKIDYESFQYGYVDKNDSLIIPYKFQYAYDFVNDYAIIREFDYYGLINKTGEIVVPVEYNTLYLLPNGNTIAKKDNQWLYLNERGSIISKLKYDNIQEISEYTSWVAICRSGLDWFLLDTNLKEIKMNDVDFLNEIKNGIGVYYKDGRCGFFNIYGQKITNPICIRFEILKNGKIFYAYGEEIGFLNNFGEKICEKKLNNYIDGINTFNDTLITFLYNDQDYIINSNCDTLFNNFEDFNDYYYLSYKEKYFDNKAKILYNIDSIYTIKIDGKVGIFNQFGKEIIPPIFDFIETNYFFLDLFIVGKDKKKGLFYHNKLILGVEYDNVDLVFFGIIVEKNNKYGVCNIKGEIIIPIEFDFIGADMNGFFMVIKRDNKIQKVGYYNKNGEIVVPLIYDNGMFFNEGLAAVDLNGKWGYINIRGEIAISFDYDDVSKFENNRAIVKKGNLYGIIDNKGKVVSEIKYSRIRSFIDGIAIASIDNQYGFINYDGKEITQFIYKDCDNYFNRGYGLLYKNNDVIKIDKDGEIILE